ncbi:MAG: DUF521 domain-containing protein [Gammaproteobacteria bacterium]|nr:DUF521 domain-containing protein [Gammaproteobacteria bacterium]
MIQETLRARPLVHGNASGEILVSDVGLSFWGGVDPTNGVVIDQHHPWHGLTLNNKILLLPSGRGSCSGSGVVLELLINDVAPAGFIFTEPEEIITLGVLVAEALYQKSIPVVVLDKGTQESLLKARHLSIYGSSIALTTDRAGSARRQADLVRDNGEAENSHQFTEESAFSGITLSKKDRDILEGKDGRAAQIAMQVVLKMADIQNADTLIDVTQAHIDACVYNGKSTLMFAQKLVELGAQVNIPTTLNALSVDKRCWRTQGVEENFGESASAVGDAYMAMGAQLSYTCAPYLLPTAPALGEQIVWAESNAVAYANSVIGAKTQKYPDFLEVFIALTGRAPAATTHLESGRLPTMSITVAPIESPDDAFWPLLGYHIGSVSPNSIPMVYGLDPLNPNTDDLKAFSAAFATTSASPMFHLHEVTPESTVAHQHVRSTEIPNRSVTVEDLKTAWFELNTASESTVDMICLGNPHFSLTECAALVEVCRNKKKHDDVSVVVTLGRYVQQQAETAGYIAAMEAFGVQTMNDTCWCMITKPVIPSGAEALMTNSGKYAHYGPGLVKKRIHFGSLRECVEAACTGERVLTLPGWLE